MRKLWLLALLPTLTLASTTWSAPDPLTSQAVCTTGSESAPTLVTQGLGLDGISAFTVHVETADNAGFTAGGILKVYLWNPVSAQWNYAPDLNITLTAALLGQSFVGFQVIGQRGRIAFVPSGAGVALTVYMVGVRR